MTRLIHYRIIIFFFDQSVLSNMDKHFLIKDATGGPDGVRTHADHQSQAHSPEALATILTLFQRKLPKDWRIS